MWLFATISSRDELKKGEDIFARRLVKREMGQ